jgi:hypothetical protein
MHIDCIHDFFEEATIGSSLIKLQPQTKKQNKINKEASSFVLVPSA